MNKTIPFILIACCIGCGQESGKVSDEYMEVRTIEPESESSAVSLTRQAASPVNGSIASPEIQEFEKKIIKTGNLTIESKNLSASKLMLDSLVKKTGGYASSENFSDQPDRISYNLTYRIPADRFDGFIKTVEEGPDKILNKNINANDVSEQYYDVKTRLENERKVEKRYLELLNRANTVKDILDIEEKLGKVRQEIESKEGRLRFLDNRVNYSTLNIWIYQKKTAKYEPAERDPFGKRLVKSLHKGWQGLVDAILFILKIWPLWIAGLLIWRIIVWLRRRSVKKK
jgi:hypothetical protein